jgi:hypothetical protein
MSSFAQTTQNTDISKAENTKTENPFKIESIDIKNITFTKPKINKDKGGLKTYIINEKTGKQLYFILNQKKISFDPTYYGRDKDNDTLSTEPKNWELVLQELKDIPISDFPFMEALSEKCVTELGITHSSITLKKAYSLSQIEIVKDLLYSSFLLKQKADKDGNLYNKQLKVKFNKTGHLPNITIMKFKSEEEIRSIITSNHPQVNVNNFDEYEAFKSSHVELFTDIIESDTWEKICNNLPKGSMVESFVQPYVTIMPTGKFSLSLRLLKILIKDVRGKSSIPECPFSFVNTDIQPKISPVTEEKEVTKVTSDSEVVEDSDEEIDVDNA